MVYYCVLIIKLLENFFEMSNNYCMLYKSPFESWNDLWSIVHIIIFLNDAIDFKLFV
jgi:hypothetical protein